MPRRAVGVHEEHLVAHRLDDPAAVLGDDVAGEQLEALHEPRELPLAHPPDEAW